MAGHDIIAYVASSPTPPNPATVLVADQLRRPGRPPVDCLAAPLLVGELRRHGIDTTRGPLDLGPDGRLSAVTIALAAVIGGNAGLGIAAGDTNGERVARAALARCLAVADGPRRILLAAPRSFCAGVERAIDVVERLLDQRGGPIYVRKEIVHNRHVVAGLRARGAVFVDEVDEVPDNSTLVFSAHGVSPAVRSAARRRGLDVIDATCPLVTKVHAEARRYAARGDTVILIGHAGHEEVDGTLGEAPEHTILVETADDVARLRVADPDRVSYLTQTTLAVDETTAVIDALRARFPALRGPASDDICYATTNRQEALAAIAEAADVVLVVGSANSSNSRRLVELAGRYDTPAHLIDDASDIRPAWLANTRTVGLTAGASAPPHLVDEVITTLAGLGPVTTSERTTTTEAVRFTLPTAVRVKRPSARPSG
ncbi:MAG TPA: 4-hydroxy-3-methylbut-2-enyl diphosphate reductase [Pseudonocardiaceae bacterium]